MCARGGDQFEFEDRLCSASVLVKKPEGGAWVEENITGVYNGHVILASAAGLEPFRRGDCLYYEPERPAHDPQAPKAVSDYLKQKWLGDVIKTETFYLSEFNLDGLKPGSFVAFNVKCSTCSSPSFRPLPQLDALETYADYRKRRDKLAAHKEVVSAEAALCESRKLATRAQECLAKAQEDATRAQESLAKAEEGLASLKRTLDSFDGGIVLVEEMQPLQKKRQRF
jgi:hypothetical protein